MMFDSFRNADDLKTRSVGFGCQPSSNGAFAREQAIGHGFVDNDHRCRTLAIFLREASSRHELDAHGLVVSWANNTCIKSHLVVGQRLPALDKQATHVPAAAKRHHHSVTDLLNTGSGFQLLE